MAYFIQLTQCYWLVLMFIPVVTSTAQIAGFTTTLTFNVITATATTNAVAKFTYLT